jgi:ABC-2 type transport system ATP-binding protein
MTEPIIVTRDLRASFGDKPVLEGINLTVREGAIHALLGPNGAGKTTLVRILTTLLRPDSGIATVAGHDVVCDRQRVREAISLTGQYAARQISCPCSNFPPSPATWCGRIPAVCDASSTSR